VWGLWMIDEDNVCGVWDMLVNVRLVGWKAFVLAFVKMFTYIVSV